MISEVVWKIYEIFWNTDTRPSLLKFVEVVPHIMRSFQDWDQIELPEVCWGSS